MNFALVSPEENQRLQLDVASLLVAYLKQLEIEYVFGIPGGAIEPLYNALARSVDDGPKAIVARHESGAAFMADGYASHTGRLGVCCATTGPGATNLLTGVASAYANQIPMLIITAQTALSTFGKGAFQESSCTGINTVGIFEYCTRFNTLVSHQEQFERKLVSAILHAFGNPPGPVHLSVPLDVLRTTTPFVGPSYDVKKLLAKPALCDEHAITDLIHIVKDAKKVVFLVGEGALEGIDNVIAVASLLDATLITTPHGKGLVSPYNPKFKGVIGFAGHPSAYETLMDNDLDVVVAIGTTLGEWASNGWDAHILLNERLVHIDEQESNFIYTPMARLHVRGQIKTIFEHLKQEISCHLADNNAEYFQQVIDRMKDQGEMDVPFELEKTPPLPTNDQFIKPQSLMKWLPRIFPPSTRYLADTGASFAWAIHYLHPYDRRLFGPRNARGGLFRACMEFASMGWAIGCAIGASFALKRQPVVCITGDGSVLMSGQEVTVAVQEHLPVVFVILNDSALGMVKHGQRLANAEPIGTEMPFTDFAALAESMGANGIVIRSEDDLQNLDVDALIKGDRPTFLDCRIDPNEVPPIGMRINVLKDKK